MNIWYVARYFPPVNEIATERAKKFVNYFMGSKDNVTVFTVAGNVASQYDKKPGVSVFRSTLSLGLPSQPGTPFSGRYIALKAALAKCLTFIFTDQGWSWIKGLGSDLNKAYEMNGKPDIIIASGNPFVTFLLLARFSRKYNIPLVLDYRDTWSNNPQARRRSRMHRNFLRLLERFVNDNAAMILTVSKVTAQNIVSNKNAEVVYNFPDGFYVDELRSVFGSGKIEDTSDRLTICYTGVVYEYGERSLRPFCQALKGLGQNKLSKVSFHYCGLTWEVVEKTFKEFSLEHVLINHKNLDKLSAVKLVRNSDMALNVVSSKDNPLKPALKGVITTKIFDYLVLGKNILNIVPDGYEFIDVMDRLGVVGISNYDPEKIDSISNYIESAICLKLMGSKNQDFYRSECNSNILKKEFFNQISFVYNLMRLMVEESRDKSSGGL